MALDFTGNQDWASLSPNDEYECIVDPGSNQCKQMSVSVWISILGLPENDATSGGILTTRDGMFTYGTQIYHTMHGLINYIVTAPGNKEFELYGFYPEGWFHCVLTFDRVSSILKRYVIFLLPGAEGSSPCKA